MTEPLNCPKCDRKVVVLPQDGGRGTNALTAYSVQCECGLHEKNFGQDSGRHRSAVAEWNRFVRLMRRDTTGEPRK